MKTGDILYEKRGSVAVATFDRPEELNAFRDATFREFAGVLDDAAADDGVGALVLTGGGRAFSSGIDLKELAGTLDRGSSDGESRERLDALQDLTRRMVEHPKVIVAAVNGVAVGLGAELAIASDVRIAAEDAYFAFAEARRGLFQTNGVMYFLPRLVGHGRAARMLLTGEKIEASEALEAGLVTRVVAGERLLGEAVALAGVVAGNAPVSVRLIKAALRRTWDLDLEEVLRLEVEGMLECLGSADVGEGTRAFVEKRAANYEGK